MRPTHTLCFLTRGDKVLMIKRRKPPHTGLWNGVGGKIESGEGPLAGCIREVDEETGFRLSAAPRIIVQRRPIPAGLTESWFC